MSASPKPPLHVRLMARHPLKKASDRERAARGLAEASAAYAARGAYSGAEGPWWRVWRAIERARGHRLREAIASLPPDGRRWFALWSFGRGRKIEGATAYAAYVADPGEIGPFDRENVVYLEALAARRPPAEIVRIGRALIAKTSIGNNAGALRVVQAAMEKLGDGAAILASSPRPDASSVHDGEAWARYAIAQRRHGDADEARAALAICAKLGVGTPRDRALQTALLEAMELTPEAWSAMRAPWDYPKDDLRARWRANLGWRAVPSSDPSPHVYGGDAIAMPDCPGCGHRMHALYTFEVAEIPAIAEKLPGWRSLPLVVCADCSLMLLRRDFLVDRATGAVQVLGVSASPQQIADFGKALSRTLAPIDRQPVALVRAQASEEGSDRTQIGGEPDWVQDFERAFCPLCHEEMTFVAALGSDWRSGLRPEVTINNGSGYQYHFACAPCGVLGVFGQNT